MKKRHVEYTINSLLNISFFIGLVLLLNVHWTEFDRDQLTIARIGTVFVFPRLLLFIYGLADICYEKYDVLDD